MSCATFGAETLPAGTSWRSLGARVRAVIVLRYIFLELGEGTGDCVDVPCQECDARRCGHVQQRRGHESREHHLRRYRSVAGLLGVGCHLIDQPISKLYLSPLQASVEVNALRFGCCTDYFTRPKS